LLSGEIKFRRTIKEKASPRDQILPIDRRAVPDENNPMTMQPIGAGIFFQSFRRLSQRFQPRRDDIMVTAWR